MGSKVWDMESQSVEDEKKACKMKSQIWKIESNTVNDKMCGSWNHTVYKMEMNVWKLESHGFWDGNKYVDSSGMDNNGVWNMKF